MSSISSLSSLSSESYSSSIASSCSNSSSDTTSAISSVATTALESTTSGSTFSSLSHFSGSLGNTTSTIFSFATATFENATNNHSTLFRKPQGGVRRRISGSPSYSATPSMPSSSSTTSTSSPSGFNSCIVTLRGHRFVLEKPKKVSSYSRTTSIPSSSSTRSPSSLSSSSLSAASTISSKTKVTSKERAVLTNSNSSSSSTALTSTPTTVEADLSSLSVSSSSTPSDSHRIAKIAQSKKALEQLLLLPKDSLSEEDLCNAINAYRKNHAHEVTAQFLVECFSRTNKEQYINFLENIHYVITNLRWPINVKLLEQISSFEEVFNSEEYLLETLLNISSNPSVVGFDKDCLHFYLFYGFPLHSSDDPVNPSNSKLNMLVPDQTTVDLYFHQYLPTIESQDEIIEKWLDMHGLKPSKEAPSEWILPFCQVLKAEQED